MKRALAVSIDFLANLRTSPKYDNIILGAGRLARDLQTKLRLLNIKSSFLVGDSDDESAGVVDYRRLSEFADRDNFRFISAFDQDDAHLLAPLHSAARGILGAHLSSPFGIVPLNELCALLGKGDVLASDAHIHDVVLRNNRSCEALGDNAPDDLHIHVFGGSTASSIYEYSRPSLIKCLHGALRKRKFRATLHAWGQIRASHGDLLLTFLRDAQCRPCDLVVFYGITWAPETPIIAQKNLLHTHTSLFQPEFISRRRAHFRDKDNNGISHRIGADEMSRAQHRVMLALAKRHGFKFWQALAPYGQYLPLEQARRVTALGAGQLARMQKRKEEMLAAFDDGSIKDYTGSFAGADDIFGYYVDYMHLTPRGNSIVAERMAEDVIAEFGQYMGRGADNG